MISEYIGFINPNFIDNFSKKWYNSKQDANYSTQRIGQYHCGGNRMNHEKSNAKSVGNQKNSIYNFENNKFDVRFYHATNGSLSLKTLGCLTRGDKNKSIINRCTDKYSFHYILVGKGFFNGKPFETEDILYCSSNTPYTISPDINEGCIYAYFTFSGGKSLRYLEQLGIREPFKIYKTENMAKIAAAFYDLIELPHEDAEAELYWESAFLRILSYSKPQSITSPKPSSQIYSPRIEKAIKYIAENYDNPELRITDIATLLEANERYLSDQFKKEVGTTMYQYITDTRMNAAIALLKSSNYNINQISEYVGYNDHQNFHNIFKKRFGVAPNQFKKSEL